MAEVTDRAAEPFPVARIALATLAVLASAYAAFLLYAMAEPMYGAMAAAQLKRLDSDRADPQR